MFYIAPKVLLLFHSDVSMLIQYVTLALQENPKNEVHS